MKFVIFKSMNLY